MNIIEERMKSKRDALIEKYTEQKKKVSKIVSDLQRKISNGEKDLEELYSHYSTMLDTLIEMIQDLENIR